MTTVEGIYYNGRVELAQLPPNIADGARVIVTFIDAEKMDSTGCDVDLTQLEFLRVSLATFAEDWNSPVMSVYDNYDAAKSGT